MEFRKIGPRMAGAAFAVLVMPDLCVGQGNQADLHLAVATPDANHWRPTWSPDGAEIAFSALTSDGNYEICIVTLATRTVRQLTEHPARDWRPKWSPDGKLIAFSSNRDGNGELYVIDPSSGETIRLTNTDIDEDRMSWSPDAQQIVYDAGSGGEWDVWTVDVRTRARHQLTHDAGFEGYPAWSPDGRRVAFNANIHAPDGGAAAREIYFIDLESKQMTRLTSNGANDQSPAWSPDGKRIAYFSQRDGNPEIYVMQADGSGQTRLTHDQEWDFMPDWSPDGKRIAFDSRRDGRRGIYVMAADGSDVQKLTNVELSPFIELARSSGPTAAITAYDRVLDTGATPDDFFLEAEVVALSRTISEAAPVDALRLLETNLVAHPRSTVGWIALGELALRVRLTGYARHAYLEALNIDPQNGRALDGLAQSARSR